MDSDEESEYSYDNEDSFIQQPIIGCDVDDGAVALLESEVADVNANFGPDRAHFVTASGCDRIRHGPNFSGFVYFFFSLEEKASVGRLWGFDPAQPIVVRFGHYFVTTDTPFPSRKHLLVTVYQGDEPRPKQVSDYDSVDMDSTERSSGTSTAGTKSDPKQDAPSVDVIKSISTIPFRVGDQITRITEEYLVDRLGGVESRSGRPLALSDDSLSKQCQACTYLNPAEATRCSMCEGTELIYINGEGLLPRLFAHLWEKVQHLNRFCVNCTETHLPGIVQPSYPTVCQRELCQWSLAELGIGRASIDDMALHADVVDLLIAITRAAANSERSKSILVPFPQVFVKKDDGEKEKVLDPEKPDFKKAGEAAKLLPSMQKIASLKSEDQLEEICNEGADFVYGLLQWIITSCPARIVSLQGDHRLRSMGTEYQFLIRSASPEHEEAFARAKRRHGSSFAFHGSSIENWHSILRRGLLNCSGTSLQMHGASYGSGVYLSTEASTSLGYSKVQGQQTRISGGGGGQGSVQAANRFVSDKDVRIMALCEVIDDGSSVRRAGGIWVVPNEKHVIPRFLFVFVPSSTSFADVFTAARGCSTNSNAAFEREVRTLYGQVMNTGMYQ